MFHSYILTLDYNVYLYLINRMVVNSRVKSGVMAYDTGIRVGNLSLWKSQVSYKFSLLICVRVLNSALIITTVSNIPPCNLLLPCLINVPAYFVPIASCTFYYNWLTDWLTDQPTDWLTTNWLTNSMEQSPWEASSHSASWETPCSLWNLKVHYHVHSRPLLVKSKALCNIS